MKIALVCPHIFMQQEILPGVIFSPGELAIQLADGLVDKGNDITIFSPGKVKTKAQNITGDLTGFDKELQMRGYGYQELLKKHPLLFSTLARQVQAELISQAYKLANQGEYDLVHVYMNEEELALITANFCNKPVLFTHHDPYNLLASYRSIFPKYKNLNYISISFSQRKQMPEDTNWVGNVYHGIDSSIFYPKYTKGEYFAYLGRIIESKGVHLAIEAAKKAGVKLKIAGKYYGTKEKNKYWNEFIKPQIDNDQINYVGFISSTTDKNKFLANAKALLVPSTFDEPFGMVMLEAMASGTPVIGLDNGAIPEVVEDGVSGFVVEGGDELSAGSRCKTPAPATMDGVSGFVVGGGDELSAGSRCKTPAPTSIEPAPASLASAPTSIAPAPTSLEQAKSGLQTSPHKYSSRNHLQDDLLASSISNAIKKISEIDRKEVRKYVEEKFSLQKMVEEHEIVYKKLIRK